MSIQLCFVFQVPRKLCQNGITKSMHPDAGWLRYATGRKKREKKKQATLRTLSREIVVAADMTCTIAS